MSLEEEKAYEHINWEEFQKIRGEIRSTNEVFFGYILNNVAPSRGMSVLTKPITLDLAAFNPNEGDYNGLIKDYLRFSIAYTRYEFVGNMIDFVDINILKRAKVFGEYLKANHSNFQTIFDNEEVNKNALPGFLNVLENNIESLESKSSTKG